MNIGLFFRGLVIGFSIAAVVGPIGMLCIQRTLHNGFLYGFVTGMGAATADGLYGSVAGFGLTALATFLLAQLTWIRLIGGAFLIYLGIRTMLTRPAEKAANAPAHTFFGAYFSTLLLTLTNPLTILSFAAIFAGIGVGGGTGSLFNALLVVCGVFLGSALWWCLLTGGLSLLRDKFTARWLRWVNRLSGGMILLFGVVALAGLLLGITHL
ncbi:MAG TPA: LysE family transporter [Ktedonobacteraceae bacterium]|nr:LysE family transporter [Ktedonobacteraceae bacterium]